MAVIPLEPADHGILSPPTVPKSPPHNLSIYDLGPTELANHFIGMIYRKRVETMTKQDLEHIPSDAALLSGMDELVVYSPQINCLYRYQVDEVPEETVQNLEGLAHAQYFGVGCFNQLCEALKKEIQEKSISENPEEDFGKGVEGAVAMLAALSLQVRSYVSPDHTDLEDANNIKVHVVLVDGLGESHKYSHILHADSGFQSFLEEMDQNFSKYCDPYNVWVYKNWNEGVQGLKKTGPDQDPSLHNIEGLISMHKATKDEKLPQWMYYTILEGGDGEKLDIKDEESFKTMVERATKKEYPGCLMRTREARFRKIFAELRFLELKQLALVQGQDDNNGGEDEPFFDPEPLEGYHSLTYLYNLDHKNLNCSEGEQHDDWDSKPGHLTDLLTEIGISPEVT